MTPNEKLLREELRILAQAADNFAMDVNSGAMDERIEMARQALAATEQPARQDAAYAELRARIERARKVRMDVDIHPDALENILADNDRLTERVIRAERALISTGWQDLGGHEWKPPIGPDQDALAERVAVLEAALREVLYIASQNLPIDECEAFSSAQALLTATPHPHADEAAKAEPTAAARDVLAERERQQQAEGWTPEHDDEHDDRSLAQAAACYAMQDQVVIPRNETVDVSGGRGDCPVWRTRTYKVPSSWPISWSGAWWKPGTERRSLVKAGALILAEIERLDRADPPSPAEGE